MTELIWVHRSQKGFEIVEDFVSRGIWGESRRMMGDTALAVIRNGEALGAVIYQNYSKEFGTIELSAAATSARWMSRKTLFEIYKYPFLQLGCQAVVMRCDPQDERLARIHKAYGFKRYDIPRLRGRNKSEAIYVLSDEDWRNNGFHKELSDG